MAQKKGVTQSSLYSPILYQNRTFSWIEGVLVCNPFSARVREGVSHMWREVNRERERERGDGLEKERPEKRRLSHTEKPRQNGVKKLYGVEGGGGVL
jgi:hypothetical protein